MECRKNETQAECHARLKCRANEELEDCQKRLANQPAGDREAEQTGREREADQSGGERRDRESSDNDRDDRDDRGDRDSGDDHGSSRRHRGGSRGSRGGGGGGGASGFEANKTFGLGLEVGEPTGLNGKYFVTESGALDFGIGWVYRHYYYGDGLHLYADYLWHPVSLVSSAAMELPVYVGVGARFWDFDYCYQGVCTYGGSAIGIRVPVGLSFDFNNVPLDIFVQLVPTLDFTRGDYYDRYRDRNHLGIDLSAGVRFWLK